MECKAIYAWIIGGGLFLGSMGIVVVIGIAVRKGEKELNALSALMDRVNAIRILTVGCIVLTAGILALAGCLDNPITTLFSGIAGYVLGGASLQTRPHDESSDAKNPPKPQDL